MSRRELRAVRERTAVVIEEDPGSLEKVEYVLAHASVEVIGKTSSLAEATELVEQHQPDLVVIDTATRERGRVGLEWLRELSDRYLAQQVIALSSSDAGAQIEATLSGGGAVYVVKSTHPEDVAAAIRQLSVRSVYFPGSIHDQIGASTPIEADVDVGGLTRREREILLLVTDGLSNRAIAKQLRLSDKTVKSYLTNVYRKLAVQNRTEASRWAHQHGLVTR
jgi:two-component system nitrate/nitrite response regulator NarL